jgi:hypothetical protein
MSFIRLLTKVGYDGDSRGYDGDREDTTVTGEARRWVGNASVDRLGSSVETRS